MSTVPFRGCLEGICGGGRGLLDFTEPLGLLLLTSSSFSLELSLGHPPAHLVVVLFAWLQVTAPRARGESCPESPCLAPDQRVSLKEIMALEPLSKSICHPESMRQVNMELSWLEVCRVGAPEPTEPLDPVPTLIHSSPKGMSAA